MRRLTSSCCLLFAAAIVASSSARAELVGHWKFDDNGGTTLSDSSTNGLDGTLAGSPTWAAGHTGTVGDYSLNFDGSNYVNLGNPSDLAIIGDQTISLWVYPTDTTARRNPYAKAYSGSGTLTQNTSGSATTSFTYYYGDYGGNGPGYEQRGISPITLNAWNHVVVTRYLKPVPGTGQITMYVNGVPTQSYTPTFTSPDGSNPVVEDSLTAYFAHGYVSNYIGNIDDAQIYSVALSEQEVQWLHQNSRQSVPTWDGSVGTWGTAGSWSTGVVPNLNGSDSARVDSGTVTYTPANEFIINNGNSLNISGTGTWAKSTANWIRIGESSEGTVNQTGGTFDASAVDNVRLGFNASGVGNYNLNGGTLIVNGIDQGAGTANFSFDGGTLKAAASFSTSLPMTINGNGATVDNNGNTVTLSGTLLAGSGNGGLTTTGSGTVLLSGTNTYTGTTTVAEGTLEATALGHKAVAGNLGAGTTIALGSNGHNGTLKLSTAGVRYTNRDFVLAAGGSGTIDVSDSIDISGVISGGGDLIKTGTNGGGHNSGSRLSLSGNNTYTGDTYINEGVIQVARNGGAIPDTSNVHIAGGAANGRLRLVYHDEAINGLYGDGIVQTFSLQDLTLTVGAAGGDGSFSGVIEPGISLVKAGSGTQTLSGTSTFTGNVTVEEGTLAFNSSANIGVASSLGAGSQITLGGATTNGTLRYIGSAAVPETDRSIVLAAGGGTFHTTDRYFQVNGTISGDGDLTKRGSDGGGHNSGYRLSLNANNIYTGDTYIDEGVLQVGTNGTIPDTSDVHIAGGAGRLRLNRSEAINGLYGDGIVQTFSGNPQTLTIGAAGGDGNFSGVIEPGISLVKTGAGTQILSGTSTYTGTTTVAEGTLEATALGDKGVAGNLGAGTTITLGSNGHNGTLKLSSAGVRHTNRDFVLATGGSGTVEVSDFIDIRGVISGDGDFIKTGTNSGGHNSGSRLSLSANNTYTGDMYINEGVVQVARNGGAIPDTSDVHIAGGAGNGRLRLVYYGETINGLFGDGIVQTYSLQNQTLTVGAANGDGNFSGVIEPGISLVKTGSGTQILSGASTYSGGTTISGGTLVANHSSALGSGALTINGGTLNTSVNLANAITLNNTTNTIAPNGAYKLLSGQISGAGGFTVASGGGTPGLQLNNPANDFQGNVTVNSGTYLRLTASEVLPDAVSVAVNGNLRLDVSGGGTETIAGLTGSGRVWVPLGNNATQTLRVGSSDTSSIYAGTIGASGQNNAYLALSKIGTGTLTLTAANSYGGGTTIEGGTLLANNTTGSGTGTGAVLVDAGTLGGTGTIAGLVTVNAPGTLAPGASPGILTLGSGVTLTAGSTFSVELDGTTPGVGGYDQLLVTGGDVSLGGATLEVLLGFYPAVTDSFTIIDNEGPNSVIGTFDGLAEGSWLYADYLGVQRQFAITYLGGTGNDVVLTAVPEPSTLAMLLGLAGLGLLGYSRRRRRS